MSGEKTEEPTEQKLRKAHEEGQTPKSAELASVMAFAGVLVTMVATAEWMADRIKTIFNTALGAVSLPIHEQWLTGMAMQALLLTLTLTLPLAAVMVIGALVGMLMQVGIQISFKPLGPKFDSINPVNGLKRIFSLKSLLEVVQMLLRAIVIAVLAWYVIRSALPMITGVVYQAPEIVAVIWWELILKLLSAALLTYVLMGPADYALQRWQFMKDQRMSHDDIKREHKESEGDPQIKAVRRGLAEEMVNSPPPGGGQPGQPKVVIANPTHCAVALAWDAGRLPTIVARGEDRHAVALRTQAEAQGIPVFTNRSLARTLIKLPLGSVIGDDLFGPVAEVLRCVIRIDALGARVGAV